MVLPSETTILPLYNIFKKNMDNSSYLYLQLNGIIWNLVHKKINDTIN